MSDVHFGPVYADPIYVLPIELQQAQLATAPVLTKGGEPSPVTILLELEFNNV